MKRFRKRKKILMKKIDYKIFLKRILVVVIGIYLIYTFLSQQKTLNAYYAEEERYEEQIALQKEKKENLNQTKSNINSEKHIEEVAREKLDMYLPNERVYIDITK